MKLAVIMTLVAATGLSAPADQRTHADEAAFRAEAARGMDRMMRDMDTGPQGDADRDFVAMMTPHHQGAIDMARSELRYGHDEQLRRIAQEIIVEQQQEIIAMRMALPPAPSSASIRKRAR